MSDFIKEVKSIKKEINQLEETLKTKTKEAFHKGVKILFEKYPDLETFSWHQYTPYWADGDTPTFRGPDEIFINNDSEEDLNENMIEAVYEFIKIFDDDDYLTLFGDGVEISVSKDQIDILDYDHD